MNDLGDFHDCYINENEFTYATAVIRNDPYQPGGLNYIWGFCVLKECGKSQLTMFNDFLTTVAKVNLGMSDPYIEYIIPTDELETLR